MINNTSGKIPSRQNINNPNEIATLKLRQEQLAVAKKWIQLGEVKIYKVAIAEEKTFTVPVIREELVIEKKSFPLAAPNHENIPVDAVHILLSKEQVEFTKHKVTLENVSIYKQQIKDVKHIEETLKREEAKVKISESLQVKEN